MYDGCLIDFGLIFNDLKFIFGCELASKGVCGEDQKGNGGFSLRTRPAMRLRQEKCSSREAPGSAETSILIPKVNLRASYELPKASPKASQIE